MIYEYLCPNCGAREEKLRPVAERDDPVYCHPCSVSENFMARGYHMVRVMSATPGVVKNPAAGESR